MKTMKTLFALMAAFVVSGAFAQMNPVEVSTAFNKISDTEAEIVFTASIQPGWHMYSTNVVENGPTPTTFNLDKIEGAELNGALKAKGNVIKHFEDMFGTDVYFFENSGQFVQKIKLLGGDYTVEGYLEFGACDNQNCIPPTSVDFKFTGNVPAVAPAKKAEEKKAEEAAPAKEEKKEEAAKPAEEATAEEVVAEEVADTAAAPAEEVVAEANDSVAASAAAVEDIPEMESSLEALIKIFVLGLLGGLVALVTPCVWPIIPMTVSFFLKSSGDKKKGMRDATIYGASIVVIYVTLGLAVTGIWGANALNSLATNAWFNIFFFLMLVVFAASFFGAFELTLPSSWSNAIDSKAEKTGGLLGIFLMAFTLTLVSFSCTGPIIGFLLVEVSTSGNILAPTVGMLGFALALALPFTLFAMFPSWLKSMPKSGGWMNTVKVVLGFVELAFALKFLSVADLAYGWRILDRETFLAIWIALFALLGLYLLGKIKFPHDDEDEKKISVPRFFLALCSIAFAIYMIPGLWGAPLKAVSAFAPPMKTQDFNLASGGRLASAGQEEAIHFSDYEEGMAYAKQHNKPVFVDFTGYGCVNCREMEAAVLSDEKVHSIINNDFVVIELYVDEKKELDEPIQVTINGKDRKLRSVGDKWSYLQESKFGANTQPFYVLLDNEGNLLSGSYSYDKDVDKFIEFLENGKKEYKKK
jgi:thiol:disulfide interchange protein DsbD